MPREAGYSRVNAETLLEIPSGNESCRQRRALTLKALVLTVAGLGLLIWIFRLMLREQSSESYTLRPYAHTKNGTCAGTYDPVHHQYQYLGIPYALPPLGSMRFRAPRSLNESWQGERNFSSYGPMCIGYGRENRHYPQSENCLTLDIVVPVTGLTDLPVAVYIYGGLGYGSGSRDGKYNMSSLVSLASQNALPFIAVVLNFRSSLFGFIASRQVISAGHSNLGLRDQRLALHWIQENIAAFGGNPNKVTLWGGSSGADNVGLHLVAYGGRNDGLFRAAILQSGSAITRAGLPGGYASQEAYDELLMNTSCQDAEDPLDCLRDLPLDDLNKAFDHSRDGEIRIDTAMVSQSLPAIDGDFLRTYGSLAVKESNIVPVPILTGVTTNEGYDWIPQSLTSWENITDIMTANPLRKYPRPIVERLMSFYLPLGQTSVLSPPIKSITDLDTYKRVESLFGDMEINAAKRMMCDILSLYATCYSYRLDARSTYQSRNPMEGVRHAAEIGPVFQNFEGLGFSADENPFLGRSKGYKEMSRLMGLMWAGFITHLNPNAAFGGQILWPQSTVGKPQNIVFNESPPFLVEDDTARRDATDYINRIQHGVFDK